MGRSFIPFFLIKKPNAKTETIKPIDPHALIPPYWDVSFDMFDRVIDSNWPIWPFQRKLKLAITRAVPIKLSVIKIKERPECMIYIKNKI